MTGLERKNSFQCCCFQAFVSSHGNEEGGHEINIYKSCVIMAGIYVFFMVECTLKARMARKKRSRGNLHVTTPEKMVS